jgi:hypothetical protein
VEHSEFIRTKTFIQTGFSSSLFISFLLKIFNFLPIELKKKAFKIIIIQLSKLNTFIEEHLFNGELFLNVFFLVF